MIPSTRLGLVAVWFLLAVSSSQTAELLLEYTFNNDSGIRTETTERSAWDWPLEFQTQEGSPTNWHGAAGSGVSGQGHDRAFNNTASTEMGSPGEGGRGVGAARAVDPLDSVTLSGWFRTQGQPLGTFARLFWFNYRQQIYAWPEGSLTFVATGSRDARSDAAWTEMDSWLFFAVTLDGTASEDNVHFYKGSVDQPATLVSTRSMGTGPLDLGGVAFSLGNNYVDSSPTQPFDGWLDNFRLHGGTGSEGVLTLQQLEDIRALDVSGARPAVRVQALLDLTVASEPNPGLAFSWWSIPGYEYQVQASPDLGDWIDAGSSVQTGDGPHQWILSPPPTSPSFYRLLIHRQE